MPSSPHPVHFTLKPMDDIWNNISSLSSPTTNHFQNFIAPALRPPAESTNFLPPPPSTTADTMLTLLTSTYEHPDKRPKPNPPPPNFKAPATFPPQHSEKFRRLMKNRESAVRSRARKQARADALEHEVTRLAKENAKLKRLQNQADASQVSKEPILHRSKSAPF